MFTALWYSRFLKILSSTVHNNRCKTEIRIDIFSAVLWGKTNGKLFGYEFLPFFLYGSVCEIRQALTKISKDSFSLLSALFLDLITFSNSHFRRTSPPSTVSCILWNFPKRAWGLLIQKCSAKNPSKFSGFWNIFLLPTKCTQRFTCWMYVCLGNWF